EQVTVVLNRLPSHFEAIGLAAATAEASGDSIRALGYRELRDALAWKRTKNLIDDVLPSDDFAALDFPTEAPSREPGRPEKQEDAPGFDFMQRWFSER